MIDRTTLLFALPGFRVLNVTLDPDGGRVVLVESVAVEGGCPSCGVMSSRVKDRPICRLKDLPHGSVPLRLWVCKRRFVCSEQLCARRSFTEISDQIPARSRLTHRLRTKVSAAVTATNRAMSEVAADYGVAWWTVHRILVATAVQVLGQAAPTMMIGIDETRARSVRWFFKETGWARSDPWMTSIVDLDPSHPGGMIGLAPGRSGACVEAWMSLQSKEFRDGVAVVAIDPSAPYVNPRLAVSCRTRGTPRARKWHRGLDGSHPKPWVLSRIVRPVRSTVPSGRIHLTWPPAVTSTLPPGFRTRRARAQDRSHSPRYAPTFPRSQRPRSSVLAHETTFFTLDLVR